MTHVYEMSLDELAKLSEKEIRELIKEFKAKHPQVEGINDDTTFGHGGLKFPYERNTTYWLIHERGWNYGRYREMEIVLTVEESVNLTKLYTTHSEDIASSVIIMFLMMKAVEQKAEWDDVVL